MFSAKQEVFYGVLLQGLWARTHLNTYIFIKMESFIDRDFSLHPHGSYCTNSRQEKAWKGVRHGVEGTVQTHEAQKVIMSTNSKKGPRMQ